MRSMVLLVTGLTLLVAGCNSSEDKPETLVTGGYDEGAMNKAIERAQSKVDHFLKQFAEKNGEDFSVKAPITDENGTEHFWIVDLSYAEGSFKGAVGNEPGVVENVKMGDEWTVKRENLLDWMFRRDGKIHGGYTMRVLLDAMEPDQVAETKAKLADLPE